MTHSTSTSPSVPNSKKLSFKEDGAPYCNRFDDIYFDSKTGSSQSVEVFIKANNITERLNENQENFTIGETGFGSGLNFLLTLQAYQTYRKTHLSSLSHQAANEIQPPLTKLTFISVEKYPLNRDQLKASLSILPELTELAELLIEQYPIENGSVLPEKCQLTFFDDNVSLILIFNDATEGLASVPTNKMGLMDAWYLDGFSPTKNPDMWSEALFEQVARLSKEQATLSTFTIAGKIRRQLVAAGFRVKKQATSGFKKEILTAKFQQNKDTGKGYQLRPTITKPGQVAIIGGGIASACAAYALTKQGVKVTLYCQESKVAQGASSNAIGALYPLLHQQKDDISLFYEQAFWHAKALYQELLEQGFHFSHDWCGLLEVSYKEALIKRQQTFEKLNAWPSELIRSINAQEANKLSGISVDLGGLFMPNAGWVAPAELVAQLFAAAKKTNRLTIKTSTQVRSIEQVPDESWVLQTDQGDIKEKVLIVCGGAETLNINQVNQLPLAAVRGQITSMHSNERMSKLSTVICHKGYLTPLNKGVHCVGATFDKDDMDTTVRHEDDVYNIDMLEKCLPNLTQWTINDVKQSKARQRCVTPDHLPMVGAMPDIKAHQTIYAHLAKDKNWKYNQAAPVVNNLYVMTGFGARGLCSAPLLADILCADICGTPYPVDNKTLFNLSSNRFVIRDIIRGKS